jgi:hypothetical protein
LYSSSQLGSRFGRIADPTAIRQRRAHHGSFLRGRDVDFPEAGGTKRGTGKK